MVEAVLALSGVELGERIGELISEGAAEISSFGEVRDVVLSTGEREREREIEIESSMMHFPLSLGTF